MARLRREMEERGATEGDCDEENNDEEREGGNGDPFQSLNDHLSNKVSQTL